MHVKVIKGKKYWYTSKRIGKKVTSVYIGPVEEGKEPKQGSPVDEEIMEEEESDGEPFYFG
jgi:hypothetical protein